MSRVYDIDQHVKKNAGYVKIRGAQYRIRQYTVADRIALQEQLLQWQQEMEQKLLERVGIEFEDSEAQKDEVFKRLRKINVDTLDMLLEDLPTTISETVTEQEFQLIVASAKAERDRIMSSKMTAEDQEILATDEEVEAVVEVEEEVEGLEGNVSREGPLEFVPGS